MAYGDCGPDVVGDRADVELVATRRALGDDDQLLGAVVGVALIVFGSAGRKSAIPFGPFMLAGAFIAVMWGQNLSDLYATAVFG